MYHKCTLLIHTRDGCLHTPPQIWLMQTKTCCVHSTKQMCTINISVCAGHSLGTHTHTHKKGMDTPTAGRQRYRMSPTAVDSTRWKKDGRGVRGEGGTTTSGGGCYSLQMGHRPCHKMAVVPVQCAQNRWGDRKRELPDFETGPLDPKCLLSCWPGMDWHQVIQRKMEAEMSPLPSKHVNNLKGLMWNYIDSRYVRLIKNLSLSLVHGLSPLLYCIFFLFRCSFSREHVLTQQ